MPGKKDPEYFPLNLNVNLYHDFHHGKYDADELTTDDEMKVTEYIRSRNGSNISMSGRPRRTRNVSLNMTQNSDDEEEGSVQSSSDLDLEDAEEDEPAVDMMDTLVMSIREKLRMDPKYACNSSLWTSESSPPSSPYDVAHDPSGCHSSHSLMRRRRVHPYSNTSGTWKTLNGRIQKQGSSSSSKWWNRRGKSNPESPRDSPYHLLQELIDSGSLIKEAVRRLSSAPKRCHRSVPVPCSSSGTLPVINPSSTNSSFPPHLNNCTNPISTTLLSRSPQTRFPTMEEEPSPALPLFSAAHHHQ